MIILYRYTIFECNTLKFILDDDNRIILTPLTGRPDYQNGYINASYIEFSYNTTDIINFCYTYIIYIHNYRVTPQYTNI